MIKNIKMYCKIFMITIVIILAGSFDGQKRIWEN